MSSKLNRVAYSYLRYSSPQQAEGDSIRRQTDKAAEWCKRNGVALDTSRYCDPGVSAFRGRHRETGVLKNFLEDVTAGRIPKGSVLLIENMDRLSRESPVRGVNLLSGILLSGISVVTLAPDELELSENSDLFALFRGQLSQARGHDESRTKSERVAASWSHRRKVARETGAHMSGRLPGWVKVEGGKLVPVPERAKLVRQMFEWAAKGNGLGRIVGKLQADAVPVWGWGAGWTRAYVGKILRSRAVLGEFQPLKDGEPDGDPLSDYYPKVVAPALWARVQAALTARKKAPGRIGKKVANLFTGLLWDARTRGKMLIAWQGRGRGEKRVRTRVLVPAAVMEAGRGAVTFPNDIFEMGALKHMKEIDPADVTGEAPESEAATLAAELAALEVRTGAVEAELLGAGGDAPALARVLAGLDAKRREARAKLEAARHAESNPLSATWDECRGLLGAARDEAGRLRLRSLLQASVTEIWTLVERVPGREEPRGWVPPQVHCLVQIHFRSGVRRDAVIRYQPATRVKPLQWHVCSKVVKECGEDLRKPGAADRVPLGAPIRTGVPRGGSRVALSESKKNVSND